MRVACITPSPPPPPPVPPPPSLCAAAPRSYSPSVTYGEMFLQNEYEVRATRPRGTRASSLAASPPPMDGAAAAARTRTREPRVALLRCPAGHLRPLRLVGRSMLWTRHAATRRWHAAASASCGASPPGAASLCRCSCRAPPPPPTLRHAHLCKPAPPPALLFQPPLLPPPPHTYITAHPTLPPSATSQMSCYNMDEADVAGQRARFELFDAEARRLLAKRLPIPAYDHLLKLRSAGRAVGGCRPWQLAVEGAAGWRWRCDWPAGQGGQRQAAHHGRSHPDPPSAHMNSPPLPPPERNPLPQADAGGALGARRRSSPPCNP